MTLEPEAAPAPETPGALVPGTGRLSGKSGCNLYGAGYTLSVEGVSFGDAFSTEMACEPYLREQAKAFLDALHHVTAISLDPGGELKLRDYELRQICLRCQ